MPSISGFGRTSYMWKKDKPVLKGGLDDVPVRIRAQNGTRDRPVGTDALLPWATLGSKSGLAFDLPLAAKGHNGRGVGCFPTSTPLFHLWRPDPWLDAGGICRHGLAFDNDRGVTGHSCPLALRLRIALFQFSVLLRVDLGGGFGP